MMINKKIRGFFLAVMAALVMGSFAATFSLAGIKTWNVSALTGGGTRALDAISVYALGDNDRVIGIVSGELYILEFDASGTDIEDSPNIIRPDDFTTQGVWRLATSPLDNTELYPGDVVGRFATTASAGFLESNGDAVSRTEYADLFAVIGVKFGAGDGSTTFNLPDLRGQFLRGWDHGRGLDPGSRTDRGDGTNGDNIGTIQGQQLLSHSHAFGSNVMTFQSSSSSRLQSAGDTGVGVDSGSSAAGGNETRPVNINIMWMIKY